MSGFRDYIITLQEEAEELGFSAIPEAIDNGYEEQNGHLVPFKTDHEKELEQAIQNKKDEVLDKIDEAIGYIRFYDHQDSDEHIKNLLEVEEYIKNN